MIEIYFRDVRVARLPVATEEKLVKRAKEISSTSALFNEKEINEIFVKRGRAAIGVLPQCNVLFDVSSLTPLAIIDDNIIETACGHKVRDEIRLDVTIKKGGSRWYVVEIHNENSSLHMVNKYEGYPYQASEAVVTSLKSPGIRKLVICSRRHVGMSIKTKRKNTRHL